MWNWVDWIETLQNPDKAYKTFSQTFVTLYNNYFPEKKIEIKNKDLQSPWLTSWIKRSSKRKNVCMENSLKRI